MESETGNQVALVFSAAVGIFFGYYPARKAAARALADETVNIAYRTTRADTAGLIHELARIGKG